ncbi:hypothetical protein Tco_1066187 [Tanacetum coccineum]
MNVEVRDLHFHLTNLQKVLAMDQQSDRVVVDVYESRVTSKNTMRMISLAYWYAERSKSSFVAESECSYIGERVVLVPPSIDPIVAVAVILKE